MQTRSLPRTARRDFPQSFVLVVVLVLETTHEIEDEHEEEDETAPGLM